ncbi:hypothetical protein AU194_24925 [Mycobacterium sp. GA-2829]|nr:hypothetical protein AU194_24925 [Mycobacterium sp. GA-2829]
MLRAMGDRDSMVRPVDRVEALVVAVLAVTAVCFAAVAGAIGTAQYDARSRVYAEQARGDRTVTATAVDDTRVIAEPDAAARVTVARWDAAGRTHLEEVPTAERLSAGAQFTIWVNAAGDRIAGPSPPSRAAREAAAVAVAAWVTVAAAAGSLGWLVHRQSNRSRYARWDRELADVTGQDGRNPRG